MLRVPRQFFPDMDAADVVTGTVPDIISWHELAGAHLIKADVEAVVGIETGLGIEPRPIAIEEYASAAEVGIPGSLVGYIAKFERYGVPDAELAFWNQPGTLGDLLTERGGSLNGPGGASAVRVNGLGGALAGSGWVHVVLEQTASTGRTGASSGAVTLARSDYPVTGGAMTVPVTTTDTSAYRLLITPAGTA